MRGSEETKRVDRLVRELKLAERKRIRVEFDEHQQTRAFEGLPISGRDFALLQVKVKNMPCEWKGGIRPYITLSLVFEFVECEVIPLERNVAQKGSRAPKGRRRRCNRDANVRVNEIVGVQFFGMFEDSELEARNTTAD